MTGERPVRLRERAPAKVNLCLFLGPVRPHDGRHELVSVMQSVTLADDLMLEPAPPGASGDEVICPGVRGPNLAAEALAGFRAATGWDGPPVRLTIVKRVPVAAGLGGGSGDAAAALRLAARAAGIDDDDLLVRLAAGRAAAARAQARRGRARATGAGGRARPRGAAPPLGLLVLPAAEPLSTAAVYREADRLGLARAAGDLAAHRAAVEEALRDGAELPPDMLVNDLEPAARALAPFIDAARAEAERAGADHVMVAGSGPTVVGFFAGADGPERARRAAAGLAGRSPAAVACEPVGTE